MKIKLILLNLVWINEKILRKKVIYESWNILSNLLYLESQDLKMAINVAVKNRRDLLNSQKDDKMGDTKF